MINIISINVSNILVVSDLEMILINLIFYEFNSLYYLFKL